MFKMALMKAEAWNILFRNTFYNIVIDIVDSLFVDMFNKIDEECGIEVDPLGDLNTEIERTLGKLVLEKYIFEADPSVVNEAGLLLKLSMESAASLIGVFPDTQYFVFNF
ncbi:hypothetical protein Tco_0055515 [Tanacetum coccineum]